MQITWSTTALDSLANLDIDRRLLIEGEIDTVFAFGIPDFAAPVAGVPGVKGVDLHCGAEVLFEESDLTVCILYVKDSKGASQH